MLEEVSHVATLSVHDTELLQLLGFLGCLSIKCELISTHAHFKRQSWVYTIRHRGGCARITMMLDSYGHVRYI